MPSIGIMRLAILSTNQAAVQRALGTHLVADLNRLAGADVVPGLYNTRWGVEASENVVDAWRDPRGNLPGAGPALVGTGAGRPSFYAGGGIDFNGTTHFLRATGGRLAEMTDAGAVVIVCGLPTAAATGRRMVELSDSEGAAGSSLLVGTVAANTGRVQAVANNSAAGGLLVASTLPGLRVLHIRKGRVGADVQAGLRVGSAGEQTATQAAGAAGVVRKVTVGASRATVPTEYADLKDVRALLFIAGEYTVAMQDLVNEWARITFNATLA